MSNTSVNSGGVQDVLSGGTAISTTVNDGGTAQVSAGGTMSNTTVNGGGVQNVNYDGTANYTTVSGSNATQNVNSGGRASNITVGSGGMQVVFDGGSADHTIVATSGSQVVSGGRVTSTHVESNAAQHVYGGTVISTTLGESGACQNLSGGVASGTIISDAGASQNINAGATAGNTIISSGTQYVSSGGTASGTTVSGGTQNILNSGAATGTILNGGNQVVNDGGTVTGTTINGGGTQHVSGGTVTNTTVNSEGMQIVSGGTVTDTHVKGNANQYVYGGVVSGTTLDEGDACQTLSGGTTVGTIIHAGDAHQVISAGATADNTIIRSGDQFIAVGGSATGTILSGGSQIVDNGGTAIATILSGGIQSVRSSGTANGVTLDGGTLSMAGGANASGTVGGHGRVVYDGGSGQISLGGTNNFSSFTVSGGTLETQNGFHINSSGGITVNSGGTLIAGGAVTVQTSGSSLTVSGGGTLSATTISTENGGEISMSGGVLQAAGDIAIRHALTNAYGNVSAGGTLTVGGGATQPGSGKQLNLSAGRDIHISGAATVTSLSAGKNISAGGQAVSATNISAGGAIAAGSITAPNVSAGGNISASTNISADSISAGGTLSAGGNLTAGTLALSAVPASGAAVSAAGDVKITNLNVSGFDPAQNTNGSLISAGGTVSAMTVNGESLTAGGAVDTNVKQAQPKAGIDTTYDSLSVSLAADQKTLIYDAHNTYTDIAFSTVPWNTGSAYYEAAASDRFSGNTSISAEKLSFTFEESQKASLTSGSTMTLFANATGLPAGMPVNYGSGKKNVAQTIEYKVPNGAALTGTLTGTVTTISATATTGAIQYTAGSMTLDRVNLAGWDGAASSAVPSGWTANLGDNSIKAAGFKAPTLAAGETKDILTATTAVFSDSQITGDKKYSEDAFVPIMQKGITLSGNRIGGVKATEGGTKLTYFAEIMDVKGIATGTIAWGDGLDATTLGASYDFKNVTGIDATRLAFTFTDAQKAALSENSAMTLLSDAANLAAGKPVTYKDSATQHTQSITDYNPGNGVKLNATLTGTAATTASTGATATGGAASGAVTYTVSSMTLDRVNLAGWDKATASKVPAGWTLAKDGSGNVTATIETDGMTVPTVDPGKHIDILQSDTDNFFAGAAINGANAYKTTPFTEQDTAQSVTVAGAQSKGVTLNSEKKHIIYAVSTKDVDTVTLGKADFVKDAVLLDRSGTEYNYAKVTTFGMDGFNVAYAAPETVTAGESMTLLKANATLKDMAAQVKETAYSFAPLSGVTIDANIIGRLTTSKGIVTYTPSANRASKLTFGGVAWDESKPLLTRPANITFAGADVDTSKINFTNVTSLEANQKMTLVADFGDSVGTVTGTTYKVGTAFEGEGAAEMSGDDLIFKTKTGAGHVSDETHNAVMAMEAGMATLAAGTEHLGNVMDGLGQAANAGTDGTSTAASVGGESSRYMTGSHVNTRSWNAAVAVGRNNETKKGSLEYGIFGEYGKGSYTLHSDAGRGDGDGHYAGGGLLARWTNKHNVYTEASFRLGRMSDTASDILHDAAGNGYGYDVHANYFGAHVGIGQLTNYRNGRRLDVYGKYFYTRREGVSFDAGANHYDLDSVSSSLLRIGARYGTTVKRWNWYGGLAFEYEFDGKSEGTVSTGGNSAAIRAASVKGGSVWGEIGLRMDATKDNPWKADIAIYGYGGKHRGFGGNVTVSYTF
ncbi:AIDA repeat-containing protein [Succiniclasticum ruminis]|uniref:AIDA repeat-containing protein n=1 Tax=Succiniclasticum ruminis TaxID=40841 RepID=UPI000AFD5188|nr:AIDA repeat-containing protein [Succiniclasticum ruminis]